MRLFIRWKIENNKTGAYETRTRSVKLTREQIKILNEDLDFDEKTHKLYRQDNWIENK